MEMVLVKKGEKVMDEKTMENAAIAEDLVEVTVTPTTASKPKFKFPTSQDLGNQLIAGAVTMVCGVAVQTGAEILRDGSKKLVAFGKKKLGEAKENRKEKKALKAAKKQADKAIEEKDVQETEEVTQEEEN